MCTGIAHQGSIAWIKIMDNDEYLTEDWGLKLEATIKKLATTTESWNKYNRA